VTEVLSGDYYQTLSTASPHQIWSAAMVISPLLRGMFGLHFDAQKHVLQVAPHIPADWKEFSLRQIAAGADSLALNFSRTYDSITLTATRKGDADLLLKFSPALSPRAQVLSATLNGKPLAFYLEPHGTDQHVILDAKLIAGANTIKIRLRNDFSVSVANTLPALGSVSQGLHVVSESWNAAHDTLTLQTQGLPGRTYTLSVWGREQIKSLEAATLGSGATLEESFPPSSDSTEPQKQTVTIHFATSLKR
jgi:hypothetical protein